MEKMLQSLSPGAVESEGESVEIVNLCVKSKIIQKNDWWDWRNELIPETRWYIGLSKGISTIYQEDTANAGRRPQAMPAKLRTRHIFEAPRKKWGTDGESCYMTKW